jgi:hypothetical protein
MAISPPEKVQMDSPKKLIGASISLYIQINLHRLHNSLYIFGDKFAGDIISVSHQLTEESSFLFFSFKLRRINISR